MAVHRLTVHPSRPFEVEAADLVVEVYADDEKLGELRISRGSIDWAPRKHANAFYASWEDFDDMMRDRGRQR